MRGWQPHCVEKRGRGRFGPILFDLLAVLVFIDLAQHQGQEQSVIEEAAMAAAVARAHAGDAASPRSASYKREGYLR
jgi:hypothetical protein